MGTSSKVSVPRKVAKVATKIICPDIEVIRGDYFIYFFTKHLIRLVSEYKSDIILIENIAFNYLLINYFSLGHQASPPKPQLD
jgi:hypothetical protein